MFIASNLILAVAHVVNLLLSALFWAIFLRAIISWVNPDPYNAIVQFLHQVTEPILEPFRRFLPPMAIDISPLLASILIMFLQSFLVSTLQDIGIRMRY